MGEDHGQDRPGHSAEDDPEAKLAGVMTPATSTGSFASREAARMSGVTQVSVLGVAALMVVAPVRVPGRGWPLSLRSRSRTPGLDTSETGETGVIRVVWHGQGLTLMA
mgnify:CR=1 FL=1